MWYEWFFEGIGTEIIMFIIGLLAGGISGYKIGIRKNGLQKQIAKNEAKQTQELLVEEKYAVEAGINGNLRQIQKAGENAEQSQVGTIK